MALRVLFAAGLSGIVVSIATCGMYLTTASEAVNLIFEPLSLLLMPGMVSAIALQNLENYLARNGTQETHDFSNSAVFVNSAGFYFVFFYLALWWWRRRSRLTRDGASG